MSKKLFSTNKWKRYLRARQESQLRNARRRTLRHTSRPRVTAMAIAERKYHKIAAPAVFSMVDNADAVIRFLRDLEFYSSKKRNITLDLSHVTHITTDAIASLVALVTRLPVYVQGNLPEQPNAQRILVESGFFDHMKMGKVQKVPPFKRGTISQEKKSKKVQGDVARELIRFGTKVVFGTPQHSRAAYRVMIESMANTHNHAAGKHEFPAETWWGTVFADVERKRVCFTFLDTGVGIFKSVKLDGVRKLYRRLGFVPDVQIMRDMLLGKIQSSTGQPYRGKGLPAIYRLSEAGRIRSLVIIANGVYAGVSADDYKTLTTEFGGTLLYWEIEGGEAL